MIAAGVAIAVVERVVVVNDVDDESGDCFGELVAAGGDGVDCCDAGDWAYWNEGLMQELDADYHLLDAAFLSILPRR